MKKKEKKEMWFNSLEQYSEQATASGSVSLFGNNIIPMLLYSADYIARIYNI